jgi:DNA-binding NarL/FixJ family response regulator
LGGFLDCLHPPDTVTVPPMPSLKTFIVEDSPLIRENLIATLEELVALEVVGTAEDEAGAALWLARPEHQVDLVIIDIFLKGGSGLGVLRAASHSDNCMGSAGADVRIFANGALLRRRKLVVLSNYATQDMRRKCLELGADRVFDKSNEIDALVAYCSQLAAGGTGDTAPGDLR